MLFNYSNTRVTVELRELLKMTDENGKPFDLWDFEYPSYYEGEAKRAFERKVIDHYFFRQIGVETPARFKHNFATRIREIMPYYLQMYKSCEIMDKIDDPFGNIDITETFTESRSGSTTGTSTGTSSGTVNGSASGTESSTSSSTGTSETTGKDESTGTSTETGSQTVSASEQVSKLHKVSDTPQGEIANIESYMSGATSDTDDKENNTETNDEKSSSTSGTLNSSSKTENETSSSSQGSREETTSSESNSETSGTSSSTSEGTVTHTLTRQGNHGVNTYAHDMIEFRQSFINVDMMIIRELSDLFLQVY